MQGGCGTVVRHAMQWTSMRAPIYYEVEGEAGTDSPPRFTRTCIEWGDASSTSTVHYAVDVEAGNRALRHTSLSNCF